jgi:hypothetical protein
LLTQYHQIDSPQYLDRISDYLRYVYTKSVGLEKKQRKRLIKACLKHKLQQISAEVNGNIDVPDILRRLAVYFGENFTEKNRSNNNIKYIERDISKTEIEGTAVKHIFQDHNDNAEINTQSNIQHLIDLLIQRPNSKDLKNEEQQQQIKQTLEDVFATLTSLQKRFSKTGEPLLEMLKRIDKVLAAHDNSIKEATQASFDLIINSLDPAIYSQAVDRRQYRSKKAYMGKIHEMYTEKHLQLKLYHEQGRFVKDCRAIYREKMRKYGL